MSNQLRIYMTILDFDESWCVGLWSQVYYSLQMKGQTDIHVDLTLIPDNFPSIITPFLGDLQMWCWCDFKTIRIVYLLRQ